MCSMACDWSRCWDGWLAGHVWSNVLLCPLSLMWLYISWADAPKFRCPGLPGSGNDSRMGMSIQTTRLPIYGFDDTINSAQTSLISRGVGRPLGIYSRPVDMTINLVQIEVHILMSCQSAHQLDGKYTNGMKLYPISTLTSLLFSHFIKTKKVTTARGLYHIPVWTHIVHFPYAIC